MYKVLISREKYDKKPKILLGRGKAEVLFYKRDDKQRAAAYLVKQAIIAFIFATLSVSSILFGIFSSRYSSTPFYYYLTPFIMVAILLFIVSAAAIATIISRKDFIPVSASFARFDSKDVRLVKEYCSSHYDDFCDAARDSCYSSESENEEAIAFCEKVIAIAKEKRSFYSKWTDKEKQLEMQYKIEKELLEKELI